MRLQGRGSTGQAPDSLTADLKAYLFGLVENAVKQYRTIWHNDKPGRGCWRNAWRSAGVRQAKRASPMAISSQLGT